MPRFTIARDERLPTRLPADEAAQRLHDLASQLAERPANDDGLSGRATIGSRIAYRVWGASSRGFVRLPLIFSWSAQPTEEGSLVSLKLESNEGWNLFASERHELAYTQRFDQLIDDVRTQLT